MKTILLTLAFAGIVVAQCTPGFDPLLGKMTCSHYGLFETSTATNPSFSATPTFSLAAVTAKSPVRIEPGALTANVTSVTFTNKTAGAKFSIAWTQDGTGGRTVAYGASASNTCTVDPTLSITTTQFFEVGSDGTTVNGVGCNTNQSGTVISGPEIAAPGTPAANTAPCWYDSTAHGGWRCKANNSTTVYGMFVSWSGTATLGTAEIAANACATAVTTAATGVATTDVISWTPNADLNAVTGYGKASTDGLIIYPYPTADNINFKVCNGTGVAITPGAASLNWRVIR